MLAVLCLEVQVLEISRIRLNVRAVGTVVESLDIAVGLVTSPLQPEALTVVDENLVISTAARKALSIWTEFDILQAVP